MNLDQIKELMTSLENGKLTRIVVKKGDFELQLEKEGEPVVTISAPTSPYQPSQITSRPQQTLEHAHVESKPVVQGKFVSSPMVGTYYASSSPDQPVFVKVGDRVEEDMVVCIVEAMKVMNEVKAGVSGTVAEILVDNAHPVEFGTRIIRVV